MRAILLLILLLQTLGSFSQQNLNWNNTFLYAVQLPDKLDEFSGIYLTIKYKDEPLIPKVKKIGGMKTKIASEFCYASNQSNTICNLKIPFSIPKKTYYWLLDSDMVIEMATFPDRYKVDVITTNAVANKGYNLPQTFDLIAENTLNIAYLKSLSSSKRMALLNEKTWKLSVPEKTIIANKNETIEKDSTLVFSLRNQIPKGILLALPELNKNDHSVQEFTIKNTYVIENTLLIPIKRNIKNSTQKPDECRENYTDLNGKICSASGCITGNGSGLCSKLKASKNKAKYKLTISIEP
jgi:hypothetical protein